MDKLGNQELKWVRSQAGMYREETYFSRLCSRRNEEVGSEKVLSGVLNFPYLCSELSACHPTRFHVLKQHCPTELFL